MCTDHVNSIPHCQWQFTSCLFFMIFWLYLHWLPHLEMSTDHVSTAATLPTTVYIMSILFFLIFPDFMAIFALITILGNGHRPCKHYPNIVNNSICHVYSFFLIFPNFLAIFALINLFRNAHRPCNQCPSIITNSEHHPYFFTIFHVKIQKLPYLTIFSIDSGHAFWYHSVLVHSGDCSGVSTGISIFQNFGWWIWLEWYRNLQEWLKSGRDQWGIDKSSNAGWFLVLLPAHTLLTATWIIVDHMWILLCVPLFVQTTVLGRATLPTPLYDVRGRLGVFEQIHIFFIPYNNMLSNYCYIPPEQKQLLVTMHIHGTSITNIEKSTGINARTIHRVLKLWKDTGRVIRQPLEPGRPRVLNSLEVEMCTLLHHQQMKHISMYP